MTSRFLTLFLLAIALGASGTSIVLLSPGVSHVSAASTAPALSMPAASAPTRLATVVVHRTPAIPMLATVTVRPARSMPLPVPVPASVLATPAGGLVATALPGGAFGMPYYSFGKPMRHLSKD
jgi:hypothetical protein